MKKTRRKNKEKRICPDFQEEITKTIERERDNKDNLWCTYCKKPRDTKERCWKLHGKPPSQEWRNQRGQHKSQAHHSGGQEKGDFNSQEIEKLRNLIGSLEKPFGACSLALLGTGFGKED